jgi:hypothetical protein
MNILTINLLFSTFVFWIAARLCVLPKLDECQRLERKSARELA